MAEAIFKSACSLSGLPHVAKEIGHYLCLREDFVILLQGDMGVGKTTFVSHLLRSFGLGEDTPVVSPTYTIMNEYKRNQLCVIYPEFIGLPGDTLSCVGLPWY